MPRSFLPVTFKTRAISEIFTLATSADEDGQEDLIHLNACFLPRRCGRETKRGNFGCGQRDDYKMVGD